MKTFMLVACLLTLSYAGDPQILKTFYDNYGNCMNELNVQQWTPEVVKCTLQNDNMINEQGEIKKEELLARFNDIISDESNLNQAKQTLTTCYEQAYQGPGNNDEKIMTTIRCSMHITDLFDELQ
ncbi:uncharacterized protein LOC112639413 [Camponotus floridanus]|uniref:uncharacterized protein LOC112639413 n=1 Tax=Camponotus floridanus TaxID=104421 RepID=UPI000DC66FE8|nr:uncharacterized protein LOC112639413 [Camponotus floridanus]